MRPSGCFALSLLVLAAANATAQQVAEDEIYNNELFSRNSLYGKLQESLFAQEMAERQFAPINQNTGQGLFSLNPLVSFLNRLPLRRNPEFASLINTYDSCKAPEGEMGLCMGAGLCTLKGGKASGTCNVASVCCVSVVAKCSSTISLNNTYWQSPATPVSPQSTCALTVRLDQNLPEQKKQAVCQIRVDLIAFAIAQPDAATGVCGTDSFQVSGATTASPVICGDNNDQHMYLHLDSSARKATDVQLTFTFGTGNVPRSWNIKIAMIPCGATYAAPADCLQYFTGSSGAVRTFNWIDAVPGGTRQLANQDYSICFRNELTNGQRANGICYQVCATPNGGIPFRLTGAGATNSQGNTACTADFLLVLAGEDPAAAANNRADRYCGGRFNPTTVAGGAATDAQVCTTARQFRIHYSTNANEGAGADTLNTGFCLNYMQRIQ